MRFDRTEELNPTIGTVVHGVDLRTFSGAEYDAAHQLLLERKVIFFSGQDLTPAEYRDFGAALAGRLESELVVGGKVENLPGYPNIQVLENDGSKPVLGERWHMDDSEYQYPPSAASLYSQVIPAVGGDTLWADMGAAYRSLSPAIRSLVDQLEAEHDNGAVGDLYLSKDTLNQAEFHEEMFARTPPVVHPVIAEHPQSGERVLFVNGRFTTKIVGLSKDESDVVLRMLYDHVKRPDFHCRYKWAVGTVAVWDNLATQHYALGNYSTQRRMLRLSFNQARTSASSAD